MPVEEWFYADGGDRKGPITSEQLKGLAAEGLLSDKALCWTARLGSEWKLVFEEFPRSSFPSHKPPPLPPKTINNFWAYAFCVVPIAAAVTENIVSETHPGAGGIDKYTGIVSLVLILFIGLMDERSIKRSGHQRPKALWILITPIYLWKRSGLLRSGRKYFWVWMLFCLLSVALNSPLALGLVYWGSGIPPCKSVFAQEKVKELFNELGTGRVGATALSVSGTKETSSTINERGCSATIEAADLRKYDASFQITQNKDDEFRFILRLPN